mmetsp:Transcript_11122/g.33084  ORF Transcript_11122/g.33084 Transcript_11122/m.33084 type:complete len:227 (+) Transcript_11122:1059-1739(+)
MLALLLLQLPCRHGLPLKRRRRVHPARVVRHVTRRCSAAVATLRPLQRDLPESWCGAAAAGGARRVFGERLGPGGIEPLASMLGHAAVVSAAMRSAGMRMHMLQSWPLCCALHPGLRLPLGAGGAGRMHVQGAVCMQRRGRRRRRRACGAAIVRRHPCRPRRRKLDLQFHGRCEAPPPPQPAFAAAGRSAALSRRRGCAGGSACRRLPPTSRAPPNAVRVQTRAGK